MASHMKVRHVCLGTWSNIRSQGGHGHSVTILVYPTIRSWLWAELYHAYDMRIPARLPGWHRFEGWLRKHDAEILIGFDDEPRWRDRLLGWTVAQDLRCFELQHWEDGQAYYAHITDEEYEKMTRRSRAV